MASTPVNPDDWPATSVLTSHLWRDIVGVGTHTGEIIHTKKSYAWVKPLGPVPSEVAEKLSAVNARMRGAADIAIFVSVVDLMEDDLVLEVGQKVRFKIYQDERDVGGCEVTSA